MAGGAVGNAVGAGIAAYGIYNQKKDGGRIKLPAGMKKVECHAMGGGVGGLREVCGAFTGLCMAMGALRGYADPADSQAKQAHYAAIQALGARFTGDFGTLICRDLLASHGITPSPVPADRTPDYYRDRPCARYVEACARYGQEALDGEA